ncbi:MAG: discoidin domain-containing protein [Pirellulaceae bacterium]|nr:discoidin domain-containing protein [Pirellulaceae bacterium]
MFATSHGTVSRSGRLLAAVLAVLACFAGLRAEESGDDAFRQQVEDDWLLQAEAWRKLKRGEGGPLTTAADAFGAVDGVKNGKYGFHVGWQANPWWQVDLGTVQAISRIVVYNRLDYAPGLHNADRLVILTSDDGREWTRRYDNGGRHFGGVSGAKPLDTSFAIRARWVRLQIPSDQPLWFHLDEVEIYGPDDPAKNLALHAAADQSSLSPWSVSKPRGPAVGAAEFPTAEYLQRARRLAAHLADQGVDTGPALAELQQLEQRWSELPTDADETQTRAVYLQARWAMRRLVWSHPRWDLDRLLMVKRFTQETYPDVCLNHMPWVSRPGGDIVALSLGGPDQRPGERAVLGGQLGPGHVHGIDLWWDGDRVVFGYARSASDQPPAGWLDRRTNFELRRSVEPIHLFEVVIDGTGLRQITDGPWSDLDPTYAPNGDIVFVSERCGASLQCNEYDKDETSCNLYVCRPDGSDIRHMSGSKDGDYLPHCLDDGTIGYTRWEYQERGWAHIQSLWFIRPDGTGADALFKQHLNDPWALEDVRSIPGCGSNKLAAIATGHHTLAAGPVVVITPTAGMNDPRAIRIVTPGVLPPEGGMSGRPVEQGGVLDSGGYYTTPWPLAEDLFLAGYCYGEQNDPTGYGLYLIDVFGTKELIYRDQAISCFSPIPLRPRPRPPVLPDQTDRGSDRATCYVADVTHGVPGIERSAARYLRIAHRLQWPYDIEHGGHRFTEKAWPNNWTPVRVFGTVPIEEDGSAHFTVPADTPVYFQLLDENQQELRRMRTFISFQPGEQRGCVGCHETRGEAVVDSPFPIAMLGEPRVPQPPPWGTRPISFLRDVQPVFDRHCSDCHSGLRPAGGLDFGGGLTAGPERGPGYSSPVAGYGHNVAFETIIKNRLVAWSDVQGDASITRPLAFGSYRSRLVQTLRDGDCGRRTKLTDEDWLRLVTWIDANAPYHDTFVNKRPETPAYCLPSDRDLIQRIAAVHTRRCAGCHEADQVTRADWIDLHQPARSLFLLAPLAQVAGGSGRCGQPTYSDRSDPDYAALLELVTAAVDQAWKNPRRDLQSLR